MSVNLGMVIGLGVSWIVNVMLLRRISGLQEELSKVQELNVRLWREMGHDGSDKDDNADR